MRKDGAKKGHALFKNSSQPPKGMHINHDDLIGLATGKYLLLIGCNTTLLISDWLFTKLLISDWLFTKLLISDWFLYKITNL